MIIGAGGGIGTVIARITIYHAGSDKAWLHYRNNAPENLPPLARVEKMIFGDLLVARTRMHIVDVAASIPMNRIFICAGEYNRNLQKQLQLAQATAELIGALSAVKNPPKWVINLNSIAAHGYHPNEPEYAAGKAALASFILNRRKEFMERGMRVTDVFLGAVDTKMTANREGHERFMRPNEVASIVTGLPYGSSSRLESITLGRTL